MILLDAVVNEPGKVPEIVRADPDILDGATSAVGETVLHFLAVENHVEGIKLLRNLGASIPDHALYEAISLGHTETVALLLELGADPTRSQSEVEIERPENTGLDRRTKQLLRSYLDQYGYTL